MFREGQEVVIIAGRRAGKVAKVKKVIDDSYVLIEINGKERKMNKKHIFPK
jgi:ribosomal protein L14E/L6E/L27E